MSNRYLDAKNGEVEYDDSAYSPSNTQVGGLHYKKHKIQPLDIIDEYGLDYYLGNVLKYILRDKDSKVEDLDKAIHYIQLYKERVLHE